MRNNINLIKKLKMQEFWKFWQLVWIKKIRKRLRRKKIRKKLRKSENFDFLLNAKH